MALFDTTDRAIASLILKKAPPILESMFQKLNKKKHTKDKTNIFKDHENYNIYRLIEVFPYELNHQFCQTQVIAQLEGNNRLNKIYPNAENMFTYEQISKFRPIYKKFIGGHPMGMISSSIQELTYQCWTQCLAHSIFDEWIFQITSIQALANYINAFQSRKDSLFKDFDFQNQLKLKVIHFKWQCQRYQEQKNTEAKEGNFQTAPKLNKSSFLSEVKHQSEALKEPEEATFQQRILWLESILKKGVIYKNGVKQLNSQHQWEEGFVEQQQRDRIISKIDGKMLYSVEKEIDQIKSQFKSHHIKEQYIHLRKKSVLHNSQEEKNIPYRNYQEIKQQNHFEEIHQINHFTQKNKPLPISSQQPTNFYRRVQGNQNFIFKPLPSRNYFFDTDQPSQSSKPSIQKKFEQINHFIKNKNQSNYRSKESFNPSDYSIEKNSKSKFLSNKYTNYHDSLRNNGKPKSVRSRLLEAMQQKQKSQREEKQEKQHFPVRIGNYIIESETEHYIIYKCEKINMKNLSQTFIVDRIKYQQNQVKITYEDNLSQQNQTFIKAAMHILNCLGAQCTFQKEIPYIVFQEVDHLEIQIASRVLGLPISKILEYYYRFF